MDLEGLTAELRDSRARPRIPASAVGRGVLVMQLSRLGSFHALEQTRPSRFWRGFLGGAPAQTRWGGCVRGWMFQASAGYNISFTRD